MKSWRSRVYSGYGGILTCSWCQPLIQLLPPSPLSFLSISSSKCYLFYQSYSIIIKSNHFFAQRWSRCSVSFVIVNKLTSVFLILLYLIRNIRILVYLFTVVCNFLYDLCLMRSCPEYSTKINTIVIRSLYPHLTEVSIQSLL